MSEEYNKPEFDLRTGQSVSNSMKIIEENQKIKKLLND